MNRREKSVILGFLALCAAGLLFMALNRYSFYQDFIDITPSRNTDQHTYEASATQKGLNTANQDADTQNPRIDINTADLAQLESLPGIGRVTALNIIDYRSKNGPFTEHDELIEVKGIGEKKLEMLKQYVNIR
jgi:competence protein ComEA